MLKLCSEARSLTRDQGEGGGGPAHNECREGAAPPSGPSPASRGPTAPASGPGGHTTSPVRPIGMKYSQCI